MKNPFLLSKKRTLTINSLYIEKEKRENMHSPFSVRRKEESMFSPKMKKWRATSNLGSNDGFIAALHRIAQVSRHLDSSSVVQAGREGDNGVLRQSRSFQWVKVQFLALPAV